MDRKLMLETLAFVLLLAAFPIISSGTTDDRTVLWWIGLGALVLGGLLPVWTRFMNHDDDQVRDAGLEYDDRPS